MTTHHPERNGPPSAPVAVIGAGCRLPGGVDSPGGFWEFLRARGDAVTAVPADRWAPYQARTDWSGLLRRTTRQGGFLTDVAGFDDAFFGVSPREAASLDPQQRLLLEVAWEALEHAGLPPRDLAGCGTGVFMGAWSDDYGRRLLEDLPRIEAWTGAGAALGGVAARLSHAFDLHGPSVAVDTACSSSLVAVHLACQSLRLGECGTALAGGVNLVLSPGLTVTFDRAGAMSAGGRCRPFDAAADGYVRSEGCGVVVLKLLSEARRDGDRVLAVIRGSAVGQNGRSNGIMAPSAAAQARGLRQACARAGVDPAAIDYVEAHGTGTRLGDLAEAEGIGAALGAGRAPHSPVLVGSVKGNIGHTESAAGVIGLIKAVLALRHGEVPPSLHFDTPRPDIPFEEWGIRVTAEPVPLPDRGRPALAGVSSYGFGGTNAHVVLEAAPAAPPPPGPAEPGLAVHVLSGASRAALRENARRLADALAAPGAPGPADVAWTLARHRSHLAERAAVVAADRDGLTAGLRAVAAGGAAPGTAAGTPLPGADAGAVWVFSGHGSQWCGMGRELLETEPAFAAALRELDPVFTEEGGYSPLRLLASTDVTAAATGTVQGLIHAVQSGLARVWREYGVEPAAVIGHSVGEIAAAVAAGALTAQEGARLVCRRSALLGPAEGAGAMALVDLPAQEVEEELAGRADAVVGVVASPLSTVVSGDAPAVLELMRRWEARGRFVRRLASAVAFHSPHMDPFLAGLRDAAASLAPRPPKVPVYSTSLDDPRAPAEFTAEYWAGNLRRPVRFAGAVAAAARDGHRVFLEISAHPVVTHSVGETLREAGVTGTAVLPTLLRGRPERLTLLTQLGALHCHGVPVDLGRAVPPGRLADLPANAWQRRPHWAGGPAGAAAGGHDPEAHTLLGERDGGPVPGPAERVWRTRLDAGSAPQPGGHRGGAVRPAVLLATLLAAAEDGGAAEGRSSADGGGSADGAGDADGGSAGPVTPTGPLGLRAVEFGEPLPLEPAREVRVAAGGGRVRLLARPEGDGAAWTAHASALPAAPGGPAASPAVAPLPRPGSWAPVAGADRIGGTAFPWRVTEAARGDGGAWARLAPPAAAPGGAPTWALLLDAALELPVRLLPALADLVPAGATGVRVPGAPDGARTVRIRPAHAHPPAARRRGAPGPSPADAAPPPADGPDAGSPPADAPCVDVVVEDADGAPVAVLERVRYTPAREADAAPERIVHVTRWEPLPAGAAPGAPLPSPALLVGGPSPLADALAEELARRGGSCVRRDAPSPEDVAALAPALVVVLPEESGAVRSPDAVADRVWAAVCAARAALEPAPGARLCLVTRGVRESADDAAVAQSPLWGLARVAAGEYPDRRVAVVDLEPGAPAGRSAAALADALAGAAGGPVGGPAADDREHVLAPRGTEVLVPRLHPLDGPPSVPAPLCRPDGTYLVTGGLGALGLEVAGWLADRGARRLVLAGRTALPPRSAWDAGDPRVRAVRALEAAGVSVTTVALDVADEERARAVLDPDALRLPPVRGVVHAAGVLAGGLLPRVDRDALRGTFAPKVGGALTLDRLYPPGSLDFLALFSSSVATVLALPGQGAYAAANAFLESLALRRARQGDRVLCLAWPVWRGLGLAVAAARMDEEIRDRGADAIGPAAAFRAWDHAHRRGAASVAVLPLDPAAPGARRAPLLRALTAAAPAPREPAAPEHGGDWAALPPEERTRRLTALVRGCVAAELGLPAADLDDARPFAEYGMESVMSLAVRRRLEDGTGLALPATLLWNHPTAAALTAALAARLAPPGPPPPAPSSPPGAPPGAEAGIPSGGLDSLLGEIEDGAGDGAAGGAYDVTAPADGDTDTGSPSTGGPRTAAARARDEEGVR